MSGGTSCRNTIGRVWHRHRQSNCRVVLVDPPEEEISTTAAGIAIAKCERHYLPEYGAPRHRTDMSAGSCRVKVYRQYDGGGSRQQLHPASASCSSANNSDASHR